MSVRWLIRLIVGVGLTLPLAAAHASDHETAPPVCDFVDASATVAASTVSVETAEGATGTAFAIGAGEFLTAAHVIQGENRVKIWIGGAPYVARVGGFDDSADLAILRTGTYAIAGHRFTTPTVPALLFGDVAQLRLGEELGVAGFPAAISGDVAITSGRLSRQLTRNGIAYLQTSAEISPGHSGSPVFTTCGTVVGLVVQKAVWQDQVEGIGLAVAATTILDRLPSLRAGERFSTTLTINAICNGPWTPNGLSAPWLWTNILGSNDCLTQADALGGVHVGWAWEFSIWVTGVESEDHTIWRFDGGSSDPSYWWLAHWLTPGLHTLEVNEWRNGAYVGWSAPFPFTVVADLTILGVCDNDPWGEGRGFWEAIAHCHEDVRVTRTPNWTIMAAGRVAGEDMEVRFDGTIVSPRGATFGDTLRTLPPGYTMVEVRALRSWGWTAWSAPYGVWIR